MNTFAAYPAAALLVANQTISDRVQDAQARTQARAPSAERHTHGKQRSVARQTPPKAPLPWWAFRFMRPAH